MIENMWKIEKLRKEEQEIAVYSQEDHMFFQWEIPRESWNFTQSWGQKEDNGILYLNRATLKVLRFCKKNLPNTQEHIHNRIFCYIKMGEMAFSLFASRTCSSWRTRHEMKLRRLSHWPCRNCQRKGNPCVFLIKFEKWFGDPFGPGWCVWSEALHWK